MDVVREPIQYVQYFNRVGSEWWKRQQKDLFAITDEAEFTLRVMMGYFMCAFP